MKGNKKERRRWVPCIQRICLRFGFGARLGCRLCADKNDLFLSLSLNAIYHALQEPIPSLTASILSKPKTLLSFCLWADTLSSIPLSLSIYTLTSKSVSLCVFKLAIENQDSTVREIKPKSRRIMVLNSFYYLGLLVPLSLNIHWFGFLV